MSSHTVGEHSIHLSYQEVMESHIDNLLPIDAFDVLVAFMSWDRKVPITSYTALCFHSF